MDRVLSNYTRVTDVLYPFSGLHKIDPEVVKNAANRGTRVHKLCDLLIKDPSQGGYYDLEVAGYMMSFEKWYIGKKFSAKPERFFCDEYMLTGECDAIYQEGDDLVLVDFKTPQKESLTWQLQLSAYSYLARKDGIRIAHIEVVQLMKTGKEAKVYRYKEEWEEYLKLYGLYHKFFKSVKQDEYIQYL